MNKYQVSAITIVTTLVILITSFFIFCPLSTSSYWGGKEYYEENVDHSYACSLSEDIEKNLIKLKMTTNADRVDIIKLRSFHYEDIYRKSLASFESTGVKFDKNHKKGYRAALLSELKDCSE